MKARVEVDHFLANGTRRATVLYLDTDKAMKALTDDQVEQVRRIADEAVLAVRAALDLTETDARSLLLCMLVEDQADAEAYAREAARRGLLAL